MTPLREEVKQLIDACEVTNAVVRAEIGKPVTFPSRIVLYHNLLEAVQENKDNMEIDVYAAIFAEIFLRKSMAEARIQLSQIIEFVRQV